MAYFFDTTNPMVSSYLDRTPNSMFAAPITRTFTGKRINSTYNSYNPELSGSNNSGLANSITNSAATVVARRDMNGTTNNNIVSFAAGGMVMPGGGAVRPGAGMVPSDQPQLGAASGPPMDNAQIDQEAQRFVSAHPEEVQKIQQVIAYAMQIGELTLEELNMAVQLAKTALGNPASYPQIRQFAIKNGLGTEQDIPSQMDQGVLYALIVAGKSMQSGSPAQGGTPQETGPAPKQSGIVPEYSEGGMTGDKAHIAKLHPREYVIPEDALIYHGKKHFDKLVEQARTPPDDGTN